MAGMRSGLACSAQPVSIVACSRSRDRGSSSKTTPTTTRGGRGWMKSSSMGSTVIAIVAAMSLCMLGRSSEVAGAISINDPACRAVTLRGMLPGFATRLLQPYERTIATLNGQPVFRQPGGDYFLFDIEDGRQWYVTSDQGRSEDFAISSALASTDDIAVGTHTWSYLANSDVTVTPLSVTCSACKQADHEQCAQQNRLCYTSHTGLPECRCDEARGLKLHENGTCSVNVPPVINVVDHPASFLVNDWVRDNDTNITTAYRSNVSPVTLAFNFPDYWVFRSAGSIYGIIFSSSLDASSFDTWTARTFESSNFIGQPAQVEVHYCRPSQCPAEASCRRPQPSAPLQCFCDERDHHVQLPDGTCTVVVCPELHISGFESRPDINGIYRPLEGVQAVGAPVFAHEPLEDRYLYRISTVWAIGPNYTSTAVHAFAPGFHGFHPSATSRWRSFVGSVGSFVDETPFLSCRSCNVTGCPNNLQCVYNTTTSNTDVQEHTCGCPDDLELTTTVDGPGCLLPEDTLCQVVRLGRTSVTPDFEGHYIYNGTDARGHPVYFQDNVLPYKLYYNTAARAWQLVHADGTVEGACSSEARTPINNCTWRLRTQSDGEFNAFTDVTVDCAECNDGTVCGEGKLCVNSDGNSTTPHQCLCPLNLDPTDDGRCLTRAEVCNAIDVNIPRRPDTNAVFTLQGVFAGRPWYGTTKNGVDVFFRFDPEQQRWVLVHTETNLIIAVKPTSSYLPIDRLNPERVPWEPFLRGFGYTPDEGSTTACSDCTAATCSEGFTCRSRNGTAPTCECTILEVEQDGVCVERQACPLLWMYLDSTAVATLTLENDKLNDRPRYRGVVPRQGDAQHFLRYSFAYDIWFISTHRHSGFDDSNSTYFANHAFFPEDIEDSPAVYDIDLQTRVGFSPESFAFVCDVCTPTMCSATEVCETTINGTAACVCPLGSERFDVSGLSVCQIPSFANAVSTLLATVNGESTTFDLVADDHVNGRFFYRERSPARRARRASQLIFWRLGINGGTGAWAIGTPLPHVSAAPMPVATSQGLPHLVAWSSGVAVNPVCDVVTVSEEGVTPRSISMTIPPVPLTTTVLVSESQLLLHESLVTTHVPPMQTTVSFSGLTPETDYYALAYTNETSCVFTGDEDLFTVSTPTAVPSAAPSIVGLTPISATVLRIRFTPPLAATIGGAITSYDIRIVDRQGAMRQVLVDAGETSQLLSNLDPFTRYRARIAVVNAAGRSPFSPVASATTHEAAPASGAVIETLSREGEEITAVVRRPNASDHNGIITQLRVICSEEGTQYAGFLNLTAADIANTTRTFTVVLVSVPTDAAVVCSAQASTSAGWSAGGPEVPFAGTSSSTSNSNAGAVAAGVLVPLLLLIAVVALLYLRRRAASTKPYVDPQAMNMTYTNQVFDRERFKEILIKPEELALQGKLGEGQFGTVHAGVLSHLPNQPPLDEPVRVAVKFLKSAADAQDRQVFMDEAWRMRHLVHRNVVQLLAVSPSSDPAFLVLEFMDGGDLEHFVQSVRPERGGPGLQEAMQIDFAQQVCRGLAYLGSVDFVHRDLAARNILMTMAHELKIGDFGLARNVQGSAYYTSSKRRQLPLRWMAPEAVRQNKYTHLSDVYAFGVVLYEILTFGDYPWAGFQDEDVVRRLVRGEHMPLDSVPPKFHDLLLECWKPVQARLPASKVLPLIEALATPQPSGYVILPLQDDYNPPSRALSTATNPNSIEGEC